MLKIIFLLMALNTFAQTSGQSLQELSAKINKTLPEIYDHATKLMSTTVENNNFYYHFMLKATKKEYQGALPHVQAQILKTICSKATERGILLGHKANIVYRYENDKGQSLGEFMVRPGHCQK
ncbi:MAG: hypothetical protein NDI69_05165 [Bacteriovoracaceae bacterium]|nr:hypothetical protein [Bacteriovoracaceae bacterium]